MMCNDGQANQTSTRFIHKYGVCAQCSLFFVSTTYEIHWVKRSETILTRTLEQRHATAVVPFSSRVHTCCEMTQCSTTSEHAATQPQTNTDIMFIYCSGISFWCSFSGIGTGFHARRRYTHKNVLCQFTVSSLLTVNRNVARC